MHGGTFEILQTDTFMNKYDPIVRLFTYKTCFFPGLIRGRPLYLDQRRRWLSSRQILYRQCSHLSKVAPVRQEFWLQCDRYLDPATAE